AAPRRPPTAVVVEQAHRAELVPLIVAAHELTPREREITEMLVRGLSTAEIAAKLWLSPYTFHEHYAAGTQRAVATPRRATSGDGNCPDRVDSGGIGRRRAARGSGTRSGP